MKPQLIKLVQEATDFLKERGFDQPEVGIILGTGLGHLIDSVEVIKEVHYNLIPYFPTATVEFHKGKLIFGVLGGKKVVVMQGRFHLYEGYSQEDVTFPVRVMHQLGIKKLLVSNASGALNLAFKKGEMMLIDDHLNLQGSSPLAFHGVEHMGERFVDMNRPYDPAMNQQITQIAEQLNIRLHRGVYVGVLGPQLETRAEYRFLRLVGGDAVGMSTIPEVIVANHLSLPVAAISVLTDECDPDHLAPVDINDIIAQAKKAEPDMVQLFSKLIEQL
ncbi:MAG: purine nucleoside phosphorylase [Cryomorphaceae bacterium BACL21 MAG-121220-bin10]|jgi:purine-nucleoside phosphorylase|nr:MAG: purine nucleoside phosphorylase [Cryomorphaceae bacterium BACL21 MAG-121220-bin10]